MSEPITEKDIATALKVVSDKIHYRLKQKGTLSFNSRHEILGVIQEEYNELIDAVQKREDPGVSSELLDIVVGCIVGIISINEGYTKW